MKSILLLGSLAYALSSFAQTDVVLHFPPKVAGNDLTTGTIVQNLNGVEMSIDYFNYYISNLHIIHDGGMNLNLSDTVFIVTMADNVLELGELNVTNIESVTFSVGVPQDVNHADISQYTEDNPLSWQDPSMHWGWSSGYKFLLVDGYGDSNNDGTPETLFQIHSLGDANMKNVSMAVIPTVLPTHTTIVINCNLDQWMFGVNPGTVGVNHGTTGVNASVMNNVNGKPVFTIPGNAGIQTTTVDGTITHFVTEEAITFDWKDVPNVSSYNLINISGEVIASGKASAFSGSESISVSTPGSYFFYLLSQDGLIIKHAQVIR